MRERIIHAATQEILKHGFRRFRIEDVAASLGVSKKTLYKYFDGKNDIIKSVLKAYIERDMAEHIKALESTANVKHKLSAFLNSTTHEQVPTWIISELQQYFPDEWAELQAHLEVHHQEVTRQFEKGIETGEVRDNIHPALIQTVLQAGVDAIIDHRFLTQSNLTLNEALDMFKTLILHGILNHTRKEDREYE